MAAGGDRVLGRFHVGGHVAGAVAGAARTVKTMSIASSTTATVAGRAAQLLDDLVAAKPGGQRRDGQHAMARAVAEAMDRGEHLLVEAPTGVGKSLAYLAAAAALCEAGRGPVVVATATKALQEQLAYVDGPHLVEVASGGGRELRVAVLKGRSNYLCAAKLDVARGAGVQSGLSFGVRDRGAAQRMWSELEAVFAWADGDACGDGDRAGLAEGVSDAAWSQVSSSAAECPGAKQCPVADRCGAEAARAAAATADIIVVNTSLYAAHLASGAMVLPEHHAVVLDEAHTFEDAVTGAFATVVSARVLRRVSAKAKRAGAPVDALARLDVAAGALDDELARRSGGGVTRVRAIGTLGEVLAAATGAAKAVAAGLPDHRSSMAAGDWSQVLSARAELEDLVERLSRAAGADLWADACWIDDSRGLSLEVAPVEVAANLAATLWSQRCVVACSATLAVGGTFASFAARSGLDRTTATSTELIVDSPFDHREQSTLYVPAEMPDARSAGYNQAVASELAALAVAAGGRTLALFTSHRAMGEVADLLEGLLDGMDVLRQGDAPRDVLVGRLQDAARSGGVVLCATQSYWTGVDIRGDGCLVVAIDKLPFARVDDPLGVARRELVGRNGGDPFHSLELPRCATLLAQGAGRLIRSETDRGVVAVFDRRLATSRYKRQLLATLPPMRRSVDRDEVHARLAELAALAAANS